MFNLIADVMEKTAQYIDALVGEKQAAVKNERKKMLSLLRDKYAEATGEDISDDMITKLASADGDVVGMIEKLAETTDNTGLGGPSDKRDSTTPMTVKEAADAADQHFLDWVTGD